MMNSAKPALKATSLFPARKLCKLSIALILSGAAVFILHRLLQQYHLNEIRRAFHSIPAHCLFFCFILSGLSYLVLSGYDTLAFRYIDKPLSYRKILFTSFLSYAFANNTGSLSIIASGGVRYRLYGGWGFSGVEIARIIGFCMITFWLGILCLGGFTFIFEPIALPSMLHLPVFNTIRPVGIFCLTAGGGYLFACSLLKQPLKVKGIDINLPKPALALGQIFIASADLLFSCSALFVLLPESERLSFVLFVGLYILALIIGLASNVPGGLGVFESVMLLLLTPFTSGPETIGALLVFRVIYYLLPLGIAAILLGAVELRRHLAGITLIVSSINKITSTLVPQIMALSVFVSGVLLLLSGTMPAVGSRFAWLTELVPLPVIEFSHFLGSLAGMGLLILAAGLRRRLRIAYSFSLLLLASGVVSCLLKSLDYEKAIWLTILVFALYSCRSQFYRQASLMKESLSPEWFGAVFIVICGSVWLGLFVYRYQNYSHDLWWRFALHGDAPRFLRATVGAAAIMFFFFASRLFRPFPLVPDIPGPEDIECAATIAGQSKNTTSNLALLGDKSLLFSDSKNAFLMFAVKGRSWIVMGNPIGPEEETNELLWQFRNLCDHYGGWPVFYEVGKDQLGKYIDIGLSALKIGENAMVPLDNFSLDGAGRRRLRYIHNRLIKEGYAVKIIPVEQIPNLLPEMKIVSDAWLVDKKTREIGFSLGFFNERYLSRFPAAIVRQGGKLLAFANLLPGADHHELSIDLMRYRSESPPGIMDFLFVEIMIWGREQGYKWFNLGMAPLAGLDHQELTSLWYNLGTFVYRHGRHFYNFKGLREYKEKFNPKWEPRYLISPRGFKLPTVFTNLTSLIRGGVKGFSSSEKVTDENR
ncbi:MAG: bifunctional lysylphosphatidylglycerol flippase/synthetase MprF [Candidatus Scalindua sp.]|nr:bifunctional lysylphosphatidylglycerol flippase/synthetase MprF [Candidatus Scalindua sp.]MCR4343403.1 bifunctional lysylphosphatidylglycerol flippase/synthetase MprF [Candidatus Scalindua sp.]